MAIRPGDSGDLTATNVVWRNLRGGPHVPSPLYHDGRALYCQRHGDCDLPRRSRRTHDLAASPAGPLFDVAGRVPRSHSRDERRGALDDLQGGRPFEMIAENDLDEPVLATPALVGDRLYFRSAAHLWCIGGATDTADHASAPVRDNAAAGSDRHEGSAKASAIK